MAVEAGHNNQQVYTDKNGQFHLNHANLYDCNENPLIQQVGISPAPGTPNVCLVTITFGDGITPPVAGVFPVEWWLSDAATGAGLTATSASGAVGVGAQGTDLLAKVSKKAGEGITDGTGTYILSITDTQKTGFFVCVTCPGTGRTFVGPQLTSANYG